MEGYEFAALSMRFYIPCSYLGDMNGRILYPIIILCLVSILIVAGFTLLSPHGMQPESVQNGSAAGASSQPIRIGAIYNLEGPQATFDVPSARGALLAAEMINEKGGVDGRPIDLILIDGKSNLSTVTAASEELARMEVPVIIGVSDPENALAAGRPAAAHRIYFVTSGATSPGLPVQVPDYLYLACMGDNTQAAVAAEYARGVLGAENVYILYDSGKQYPTILAGYFRESFEEQNGTVIAVDTFRSDDGNVTTQLAGLSAISPGPDMVYLSAETWADAAPVIEEIRRAGLTVPIFGGDGYDAPVLLTGGAEGVNDVYYTTHTYFNSSTDDPVKRSFMTRYLQKYNETAVPFAGLGYDAVGIVAESFRLSGPSGDFPEGIGKISLYQGVTGNLTYVDGSHVPTKTVTVMMIRNGTPVYRGEYAPAKVPAS